MLGRFMRLTVGLGLERLLVVFDQYGLPGHLLLRYFRMQFGSGQKVATSCSPAPPPDRFNSKDRVCFHGTIRSNGPYLAFILVGSNLGRFKSRTTPPFLRLVERSNPKPAEVSPNSCRGEE